MKSINLKVTEELYEEYKRVCNKLGLKMRHRIIKAMQEVINEDKGMDR